MMSDKTSKIFQWVGTVLCLFGTLLMLSKSLLDIADKQVGLQALLERDELFFWGGMLIWALGYVSQSKKEKNDAKPQE